MPPGLPRVLWLILVPARLMFAWADSLCDAVLRRMRWSPVECGVEVTIDDTDDDALWNRSMRGWIRSYTKTLAGFPGELLIELDGEVAYNGRFVDHSVRWLVAAPIRRSRSNRLLLSSIAVRLIDSHSLRDATRNHTIGIGRLRLVEAPTRDPFLVRE